MRMRRLLMDALALLVIYGNVAVALQPPPLRRVGLRVPRPAFVVDAFLIPGMFSSYSLWNSDFFILGERTQRGLVEDRGRWIQLRVREHFPQRHGVIFTELFVAHHWDMHGPAGQRRAWTFLARRIREHHNRLHPERAVARVRFGTVQWPQSPLGYRAGKTPDSLRGRNWFTEPERP
jgi:hypothetical protein